MHKYKITFRYGFEDGDEYFIKDHIYLIDVNTKHEVVSKVKDYLSEYRPNSVFKCISDITIDFMEVNNF